MALSTMPIMIVVEREQMPRVGEGTGRAVKRRGSKRFLKDLKVGQSV